MATAIDIIERGYFPIELPPVFQSRELATFVTGKGIAAVNAISPKKVWTRGERHSLARPGGLRRTLTIPNPINYLRLCDLIEKAWSTDIDPILQQTYLASSKPVPSLGPRSFVAEFHDTRAQLDYLARSGGRFLLLTDIQNFFPSIYTHSIPWVLHGKSVAKQNMKSKALIGNQIDEAIRCGQEGQTMGLPIGPDTSWVLAETLMARVEQSLRKSHPNLRGTRFNDDITIATRSQAEAEGVMDAIQTCLSEYELSLNPRKTRIVQLPIPVQDSGIGDLRHWKFRDTAQGQRTDLIGYFDRVSELIQTGLNDHVASYAIARLRQLSVLETTWNLLEAQILQLLVAEPSCAKQAAMTLSMFVSAGMLFTPSAIAYATESLIVRHASLGHTSEVSWALWLCIAAGVNISDSMSDAISRVDDSVVALLALHARAIGLTSTKLDTSLWEQAMIGDELRGQRWLLSYEARNRGWLPSLKGADHRSSEPFFKALAAASISFYDTSALSLTYQPATFAQSGSGGGFSPYAHLFSSAAT